MLCCVSSRKQQLNHYIGFLLSFLTYIYTIDISVAMDKGSVNKTHPKWAPCPLISRERWIMWWVSPWGADDLTTRPDDTSVGRLFWAQSPVDLFSRAEPAASARGLEVSVSCSGPPQPTDSEQQGQLWGSGTLLQGRAPQQPTHDAQRRNKSERWKTRGDPRTHAESDHSPTLQYVCLS